MRGLRRRMRLNRYKRLEYLEFIDSYRKNIPLGIKTTPNMSIKIKIYRPIRKYYASFLHTNKDYKNFLSLGFDNAGYFCYNLKGTVANKVAKSDAEPITVKFVSLSKNSAVTNKNGVYELGVNYGLNYELTIGENMVVSNNWAWLDKVKLYYLIIDDGNGQKMDLQPVKRLRDGKNGLFDKVSGKFFDFTEMIKKQ